MKIRGLFLFLLVAVGMLNFNYAAAEDDGVRKIGNFRFEYEDVSTDPADGIWITKITPLSDEGISTLKIPSKLGGGKVTKLGGINDTMDTSWEDDDSNIFGVAYSRDDDGTLVPAEIHERVKKIKRIQLPSTVKWITTNCFNRVPDGKTINIPKGVKKNIYIFSQVTWKKLTISPKNKTYKIVRGCLLSKDGKTLYGFAHKRKKVVLPNSVRVIKTFFPEYEDVSEIVIPKGVREIESDTWDIWTQVTVKIHKDNKYYGVKNGCIYNKKTKQMVSGSAPDGVLRIPEEVRDANFQDWYFMGRRPKEVIVPVGVCDISGLLGVMEIGESGKAKLIMKSSIPPRFTDDWASGLRYLVIHVPANAKSAYEAAWKFSDSIDVLIVEGD